MHNDEYIQLYAHMHTNGTSITIYTYYWGNNINPCVLLYSIYQYISHTIFLHTDGTDGVWNRHMMRIVTMISM